MCRICYDEYILVNGKCIIVSFLGNLAVEKKDGVEGCLIYIEKNKC